MTDRSTKVSDEKGFIFGGPKGIVKYMSNTDLLTTDQLRERLEKVRIQISGDITNT